MKVSGVGVQHRHLILTSLNYPRMAVSDMGHIVIGVEILASLVVVEVLHRATHYLDWVVVGNTQVPREQSPSGR